MNTLCSLWKERYRSFKNRSEDGVTLIEVTIMVALIAVLSVVGYLSYGFVTDNARQSTVESTARQVYLSGQENIINPQSETDLESVAARYNEQSPAIYSTITAFENDICVTSIHTEYGNTAQSGFCDTTEAEDVLPDEVIPSEDDEAPSDLMTLVWEVEENQTVDLPISDDFSGTVDWGNGEVTEATNHTYERSGEYTINIMGPFEQWGWDALNLTGEPIEGEVPVAATEYTIYNEALEGLTAVTEWKNTATRDLSYGFAFSMIEHVEEIPATVEDTGGMFAMTSAFDQDISDWDMSNVTTLTEHNIFGGMFALASQYNNGGEPLDWDTPRLEDVEYTFFGAVNFDQDISDWDISNVTSLHRMFHGAKSYNNGGEPLDWDTSNITDMSNLFSQTLFDQPLNDWNTENVEDMSYMFWKNEVFNQPLNEWETGNVKNMQAMFSEATAFDQDVSDWDMSNVERTGHTVFLTESGMFYKASSFNNGGEPLDWQDLSSVTDISYMFKEATSFNQNLNSWEMPQVTRMTGVFHGASSFNNGEAPGESNSPLSWNTSNATIVKEMFQDASSFNQSLSHWNLDRLSKLNLSNMFTGATAFENAGEPLADWMQRGGAR